MAKITLGITGLHEILSRDTGLKYPIGDRTFLKKWSPEVTRAKREREDYRSQKGISIFLPKLDLQMPNCAFCHV